MKIDIKDVSFEAFSSSGPGGQYRNRHMNCVKATHIPTGLKAAATKERSLTQNKKAALEALQEKLDKLIETKKELKLKEAYDEKADASFGSQIRTYRLCGNAQGVTCHKTGITSSVEKVLFRGEIDIFLNPERS